MKILIVDDEQDICEILLYNLENEGYEVVTANSAEEALTLIMEDSSLPNLILLDVMMGEMSGFQMAQRLKENNDTAAIPIIFITALDDEDNTVRGLNIGADDYIAKPLSMKEVKARIKAVLRRVTISSAIAADSDTTLLSSDEDSRTLSCRCIQVGEGKALTLNLDAKTATLDGVELSLTKLELELLTLFLRNPGKVFSRNDLLERCWPHDVFVLDRTVDVNITRLRKKIGQYGKRIKTRVGYGYMWSEE